ncbi:hypothetical protein DFJ74DRAFT_686380 [Hyaloraphidium curvatum]|nr:hypothetical protein DFJ74DRAFT_686380 [Hyaloraphidium curvatum]
MRKSAARKESLLMAINPASHRRGDRMHRPAPVPRCLQGLDRRVAGARAREVTRHLPTGQRRPATALRGRHRRRLPPARHRTGGRAERDKRARDARSGSRHRERPPSARPEPDLAAPSRGHMAAKVESPDRTPSPPVTPPDTAGSPGEPMSSPLWGEARSWAPVVGARAGVDPAGGLVGPDGEPEAGSGGRRGGKEPQHGLPGVGNRGGRETGHQDGEEQQNSHLPADAFGPHTPPVPGTCPVPGCSHARIARCALHPVSWDPDMQRVVALSSSEYANNEAQCEVARHVVREHPCVARGGSAADRATQRDKETGRPLWSCPIPHMADGTPCGYLSSRKSNLVSHLTSKHCPATKHYFCHACAPDVAAAYVRGLEERCAGGDPGGVMGEESRFRSRGEFKTAENAKKHFLEKDVERMQEAGGTKRRRGPRQFGFEVVE